VEVQSRPCCLAFCRAASAHHHVLRRIDGARERYGADRNRRINRPFRCVDGRIADRIQNFAGRRFDVRLRHVAQHRAKAIAADTPDDVTCAQAAIKPVANGEQHGIRSFMSKRLSDHCQFVDADEEIGTLDFVAFREIERMVERLAEARD